MRIYDPRIGKFLSVDPITAKYPMLTPFQFSSNSPIANVDLDGLEGSMSISGSNLTGSALLHVEFDTDGDLKPNYDRNFYGAGIVSLGTSAAIVTDVFVTRGKITQFLFSSQIFGHLYHNRTNDPAEEKKRVYDIKNDAIQLASGYVLGKAINLTTKILTSAGKVVYKTFSSSSVRFSQSSVNGVEEIATSMQVNGWKGEPIDIVKMKDGIFTTVDNTRLLAAQKTGIDVQAVAHNYDDLIPEDMAKRFLNKKGEVPKTWGRSYRQ